MVSTSITKAPFWMGLAAFGISMLTPATALAAEKRCKPLSDKELATLFDKAQSSFDQYRGDLQMVLLRDAETVEALEEKREAPHRKEWEALEAKRRKGALSKTLSVDELRKL